MSNRKLFAIISLSMLLIITEACLLYDPARISVEGFYARTFEHSSPSREIHIETEGDISSSHDEGEAVFFSDTETPVTAEEVAHEEVVHEEPTLEIVSEESNSQGPKSTLVLPPLVKQTKEYPIRKPREEFPQPTTGEALQFVVFAFDGSSSLESWKQTLSFATEMRNTVPNFSYTYFINPVYLLTGSNRNIYMSPEGKAGSSAIGFGGSTENVQKRIMFINQALEEGHNIESHAVGHWNGKSFSKEQWAHELESFNRIFFGTNALYPGYEIHMNPKNLVGFRAPELGVNSVLYETLHGIGYQYDTSRTQYKPVWPKKESNGLWQFPLDVIKLGSTNRNILAMDYNFYYTQTGAKSTTKKDTPEWEALHKETLESYMNYFQSRYYGNRAPIYIANHFGLWNDGVYWETMKDVAKNVCTLPDVWCGSYRDLMDYMNLHPELSGKE